MRRNTADNVMGMLQINTVGNNYVASNNETKLALIKNIVTNATVEDTRYVFHTSYDNVNYDSTTQSSKSGYSWPGMQSLANKINGSTNVAFSITASDCGPSHQEVIWQPYGDHTPTT